jgi:hypothetical protein
MDGTLGLGISDFCRTQRGVRGGATARNRKHTLAKSEIEGLAEKFWHRNALLMAKLL